MNILFLIFHGFSTANGISNKIHYQIKGLRENGNRVDLCYYDILENGHKTRMINNRILTDYGKGKLASLKKRMCYKSILKYALQENIKIIYIRSFHNANPFTIQLYKQLKKKGMKVIMEIPTYPYDKEYQNIPFFWRIELFTDRIFRKMMAKQLEAIVTFTDLSSIFGRRTIRISNGIDFDSIPLKQQVHPISKEIHFLGVAEVHFWHGFDRFICGLGEYYATSPTLIAYFHIVGGWSQSEKNTLLNCIQKYHLEKYVILHGPKHGEDLDDIFEKADFAIGSLGRHRSGIDNIKTLKNREYAARGIPFIYSETDRDFEQMPYILKAPADDSPIDINRIISFIRTQKIPPLEIRNSIQHLSWKQQMKKVIDCILPKE